jgi:bacterioferritin (cytochrome b1)
MAIDCRPWVELGAGTGCGPAAQDILGELMVVDYVSRENLEDIRKSEEEHVDWLGTQLELMQKVGLQNWLQTQSG